MRIGATILILLLGSWCTFSQVGVEWCGVRSPSGDISIALPCSSYVVDHDGNIYRLYYASRGATISASFERKSNAKQEFKDSLKYLSEDEQKKSTFFKRGDFLVQQTTGRSETGAKKPFTSRWLYLASSEGEYIISVSSESENNPIYADFLSLIQLQDTQLFTNPYSPPTVKKSIPFSELTIDSIVNDALKKPDSAQRDVDLSTTDIPGDDESNMSYSRNLIVLRKPRAEASGKEGMVIFRVLFRSDGVLGAIKLIKSTNKGLTQSAFKAVKKIKFIPAEVDGKPVDYWRTVAYSFNVYGPS